MSPSGPRLAKLWPCVDRCRRAPRSEAGTAQLADRGCKATRAVLYTRLTSYKLQPRRTLDVVHPRCSGRLFSREERTMKRILFWLTVVWTGLIVSLTSAPARADAPSVIRIGVPGVGTGNRPIIGGSNVAVVHLRGLLEEEFKPDGIQIKWNFLRGAGPAVNELFANGLADFGFGLGDLPSIIGHAGGLNTRVLAAGGIRQNTYL